MENTSISLISALDSAGYRTVVVVDYGSKHLSKHNKGVTEKQISLKRGMCVYTRLQTQISGTHTHYAAQ